MRITGEGMGGGTRPSAALRRLVNGYQVSQAIHVAATLGLADLLARGPRDTADLAQATRTDERSLYRLLRALAAVGVFAEETGRRFALTPLGDCLRSDADEPIGGWAAFVGEPYYWQAWSSLLHTVRTGENAFRHVHGMSPWEYREANPAANAQFNAAMDAISRQVSGAVLAAYDFSPYKTVVDVGGGRGAFLAAVLSTTPGTRGIVFDQPHVVAGAPELLGAAGVADRCDVVGGSFFESVPEGGDAYVLKAVIHDWEDREASAILQTCRASMRDDARLLLVEREVGPPNEGPETKFSDLNMLVAPGGAERTREEFATLLTGSGFRMTRVAPSAIGVAVVEAEPT